MALHLVLVKPNSLLEPCSKTLLMVNGSLPLINGDATLLLDDVLATSDLEKSPLVAKEVISSTNNHVLHKTSFSLTTIKRFASKYFNFTFIMACFIKVSSWNS